jgi:hypothetical protein
MCYSGVLDFFQFLPINNLRLKKTQNVGSATIPAWIITSSYNQWQHYWHLNSEPWML